MIKFSKALIIIQIKQWVEFLLKKLIKIKIIKKNNKMIKLIQTIFKGTQYFRKDHLDYRRL